MEIPAFIANWLKEFVTVGGPTVVVAFFVVKHLGKAGIQQLFDRSFEKFKTGQQKEMEKFKSDQEKELERLRHLLSSRISKIHEKEFEILPKAWFMLHEAHGLTNEAMDLTFKPNIAFKEFSEAKFEEFLKTTPLTESQKVALREASDRQTCFSEAMASIAIDNAKNKQRTFHNYLIEHRIFMTAELHKAFGKIDDILSKALLEYTIGKDSNLFPMVHDSQCKMDSVKEMISDVEAAIQQRLHYGEA